MKEFYFDTNARVRFWVKTETEQEAIDLFSDKLNESGLKIDVGTHVPESGKDI